jgi:hypothetical protein
MQVKILTYDHLPQVMDIYYRNFDSISEKQVQKTGEPIAKDEHFYKMTELWVSAIKKYYLSNEDVDHILMGLFQESRLLAYVAIRYDLPEDWNDGWVVSYLKADPKINVMSNGGLRLLWLEMFSYSESLGKIRWHTITEKKRHRAFDAFGIKVVPEINNRYDFYTLCEIPANTRADVDWVYAMMGRVIHTHKDYIVRTGVLQLEYQKNISHTETNA